MDIKDFQTLLVGTLGFAGVILTLIVNAHLARKARREAIEHDRQLIKIALLEELRIIEAAFRDRIKTIEEAEKDGSTGILVPISAMTGVYDRLLDKIGLLRVNEISKVMAAYLLVKQLPERLAILARRQQSDDRPGFAEVNSPAFKAVREIHATYVSVISGAVVALENND